MAASGWIHNASAVRLDTQGYTVRHSQAPKCWLSASSTLASQYHLLDPFTCPRPFLWSFFDFFNFINYYFLFFFIFFPVFKRQTNMHFAQKQSHQPLFRALEIVLFLVIVSRSHLQREKEFLNKQNCVICINQGITSEGGSMAKSQ